MFFFKQFQGFDPVSGDVPEYPFSYMPEIASRARVLLNFRTAYEWDKGTKWITSIAKRINEEVDQYFEDIKYMEIERLREQAGLLELMGGDPEWPPDEDDLDIATAANTSEVDALKAVIEKRDSCFFLPEGTPEPEPEEYPEGKDYEFFAVLSLLLLVNAMGYLNESKHGLAIAGDYALKAMDAVGHAEHLREAEWLVSYAERRGDAKLNEALQIQKAEQRQQKAEKSKQLNLARHQKTNEVKARAVEEWMQNKTKFPSAEKAGNHIADLLEAQGVLNSATDQPYEPRTVTGWIRAHAKSIGVRFR